MKIAAISLLSLQLGFLFWPASPSKEVGGPDVWFENQTSFDINISNVRSVYRDKDTLPEDSNPPQLNPLKQNQTVEFRRKYDQFIGGPNTWFSAYSPLWDKRIQFKFTGKNTSEAYYPAKDSDISSGKAETRKITIEAKWNNSGYYVSISETLVNL